MKYLALCVLAFFCVSAPACADTITLTCPPICPPPGPPPSPTPSDTTTQQAPQSRSGLRGVKPLKVMTEGFAIGVAASATFLIVRSIDTYNREKRELYYGEAYCTAETFMPFPFVGLRMWGGIINNNPALMTPFCPEQELNKYSAHYPGNRKLVRKVIRKKVLYRRR